ARCSAMASIRPSFTRSSGRRSRVPRGAREVGIDPSVAASRMRMARPRVDTDARFKFARRTPTMPAVQGLDPARRPSASSIIYLLIGVAGLAFCITLLFLGMRAVMDIGGSCAEGGAVVIRQPCPAGVPVVLV